MFAETTLKTIAKPGNSEPQGACSRYPYRSSSMPPHEGAGGLIPSPMYDNDASTITAYESVRHSMEDLPTSVAQRWIIFNLLALRLTNTRTGYRARRSPRQHHSLRCRTWPPPEDQLTEPTAETL